MKDLNAIVITVALVLTANLVSAQVGGSISSTISDTLGYPKPDSSGFQDYSLMERVNLYELSSFDCADLPEIINATTSAFIAPRIVGQPANIFLQGLGGCQTVVLFDGIPLFSPGLGYYDLSWFPMDIVYSVDVISGGRSFLAGLGAVGGAIDLKIPYAVGKNDYTRLSGDWGDYSRRRLSGKFLKRFSDNYGLGVTASELVGDYSKTDGDAKSRDFSGIGWAGYGDFELRFFGSRHEGSFDFLPALDDTIGSGYFEDDHRIIDGKITYGKDLNEVAIRFNHQDYDREQFGESGEEFISDLKDNIDCLALSMRTKALWQSTISLEGDYRTYTIKSDSVGDDRFAMTGGRISWERLFQSGTSALLGLRLDRTNDGEMLYSPGAAINIPMPNSIVLFATAGANSCPPLKILNAPFADWENKYELFYSGKAGLEYRQNDMFHFVVTGYYSRPENDSADIEAVLPNSSITYNLGETYGIKARAELTPDELFRLGVGYYWNTGEYATPGLPGHEIQAYAEETRFYYDNELSATLRLEADGYFGLRTAGGTDAPSIGLLRGRLELKYLGVGVFGLYEYALTDSDGWNHSDYSIIPGYEMPKTQWRAGAEWELLD